MIKIFVTYRCNLACPYCFAREAAREHPHDLTDDGFERLLSWMRRSALPAAAFIGGEPTLHPRLADMAERTSRAGISPVVFTNGLFSEELAVRLAGSVANFVVNYNDPASLAPANAQRLENTLAVLTRAGARVALSKNFAPGNLDYAALLAAVDRHGITAVRYDISRPSHEAGNAHFGLDDTRQVMAHAVGFVKACEARGVRTGLDCSVRLCDLDGDDRRYLERVSMKFTGVCHPSVDVHPDLSASYCLPMRGIKVPDVTAFADVSAVMWHMARLARPVKQANVSAACLDCKDFMRRCQGGCMALKRAAGLAPEACAACPEPRPGEAVKS
jgi:hypothetical protein